MLLPILISLLTLLTVTSALFYIVCALATLQFFRQNNHSSVDVTEPVTVMIPVCGLEEGAEENWLKFCQQNYPQYEVIFGVMNPEDPAVPLLKSLVDKFPNQARLIFCTQAYGINHQASNLIHLVNSANSDIIVCTDSDMRVEPDYLTQVTAPLANPKIGVVTCGYVGKQPETLGAAIASMGRCFDFLPGVLIARKLDQGLKFAMGATIATRKSVVEKFGGWGAVVNRIGSDYHIGRLTHEAGYQVELSSYMIDNDSPRETLQQVYKRELRWARTIRLNRGVEYYGLVFSYGTVYSLLLVLTTGFQAWAIAISVINLTLRFLQAMIALKCVKAPNLLNWLWALPLRDSLSFLIWLFGCFGQKVYWRGRVLAVEVGGILTESVD